jgi:hypothetical protein
VGWLTRIGLTPAPRLVGGIVGVLGLAAIVATGLFGSQKPTRSPAEYLTWVYFWAALVILCGLVGTSGRWSTRGPRSMTWRSAAGGPGPSTRCPTGWGSGRRWWATACSPRSSWPPAISNRPWLVATLAILYSVITLAGMAVFGRNEWLSRAEGFTVLFGRVGRFGPVHAERDGNGRVRRVLVQPWGVGLLDPIRIGWDIVTFVILTLSTLAFDGLIATPAWQQFQEGVGCENASGLWVGPEDGTEA